MGHSNFYRFLRSENDSPPLLGDDVMSAEDGYAILVLDELLLRLAGYRTWTCPRRGFHALRITDGRVERRQVHLVPVEAEEAGVLAEVLDLRPPVFAEGVVA